MSDKLDFTIDELRVTVSKDYQLYFDSPIGVDSPHMPTVSADQIRALQSKLGELLQNKMLDDFANETDEQKKARKDNALTWVDSLDKDG